ncbi:MAG: DUF695 domain-containing protein [Bacteroidales bacterium]
MKEYRVVIPEEKYQVIEFVQETVSGVAIINSNLKKFEFKKVFAWHCSIWINLENSKKNGMPTTKETEIIKNFSDKLDKKIKGEDKEKPNALFLAKITWNESCEIIWRVFDPEITNIFLKELIDKKEFIRKFDYRIDHDEEWKLADWHLGNCSV